VERRKKSDNRLIDFCFTPSPLFIPRSNPRFGVGWRAEFEVTGKICYTVVEFDINSFLLWVFSFFFLPDFSSVVIGWIIAEKR